MGSGSFASADANSIQINLGVDGCNLNGICEAGLGETIANCAVDCTPPSPAGNATNTTGFKLPDVYNVTVSPELYSAIITWNTGRSTISTVRWGTTPETKDGTTRNIFFARNHKIQIINLAPGTMYYFTLENYDIYGNNYSTPPTYFFTKFLIDTAYPLNPRNVRTSTEEKGIRILWLNPADENFSYVRIMRHQNKFTGDPFVGKLIYEGNSENFLDTNVLAGKKYFYSLFSRNLDGRYSSGVGTQGIAFSKIIIPKISEPEPENITERQVGDFFVHQYNQPVVLLAKESIIEIKNNTNTIVDTSDKTEADDYLVVSYEDGEKFGQYLFSYNQDSARYQSVVSPLPRTGKYTFEVLRFVNNEKKIIAQGWVLVEEAQENIRIIPVKEPPAYPYLIFLWILLLILLILAIFILLRRRKNEESQGL